MERRILTYGGYFEEFMATLDIKVRRKINYGLDLLKYQDIVSKKFVKYIREGIFEMRTEWEGNIYRVFFIFDGNNIVVLFNGFQKKTQKTPNSEITKALKIKKDYYNGRR
ncbi:MAG: type II toxin-antitoxin system RelE/ParE family toxin [Muribaculaceae bacterium]|nr:type II toxin-antitoxin system RelE/ParE family toxin [Muribaculaceae bacterium]